MAKVQVSLELIEDLLFRYADNQVHIRKASIETETRHLVLEIEGADVPDAPTARVTVTVQQNRAGEKLHRMTFEPVNAG